MGESWLREAKDHDSENEKEALYRPLALTVAFGGGA
jgi:hypothetical protein